MRLGNKHFNIRQIDNRLVAVRFGFHTNLDLFEKCSVQVFVCVTNLEWNATTKVSIQLRNADASAVRQAKCGVHWHGYEVAAIGQEILMIWIKINTVLRRINRRLLPAVCGVVCRDYRESYFRHPDRWVNWESMRSVPSCRTPPGILCSPAIRDQDLWKYGSFYNYILCFLKPIQVKATPTIWNSFRQIQTNTFWVKQRKQTNMDHDSNDR